MDAKWIAHTKGGPDQPAFEIAVVREDNKHGLLSYGWFDDRKLLISHNGGPGEWRVTPRVWAGLVGLAERIASELNAAG